METIPVAIYSRNFGIGDPHAIDDAKEIQFWFNNYNIRFMQLA